MDLRWLTNTMHRLSILFCLFAFFTSGCGPETPSGENAVSSRYQPGQVWSYQTRDGEEESQLVILRLDADPRLGTIVHVYIDGVSIRNPHAPSGVATEIGHMPFAEAAIDESVVQQVGTRQLPDFQEGYDAWREAFDAGRGGVFSIPAAEAVEYMEQALNQPR